MATRKGRKRKSTGGKRGRPRKHGGGVAALHDEVGGLVDASGPPSRIPAVDVDSMIAAATSATPGDQVAALDSLAHGLELDARERADVMTGEVHDAAGTVSDKAVQELSNEVAALATVLFGIASLFISDVWQLDEDEAGLIGDATARPYARDAEELKAKIKWLGPTSALVGVIGVKTVAEVKRRREMREQSPRMPGTAPAGE